MRKTIFVAALIATFGSSVAAYAQGAGSNPAGDATAGKKLFLADGCWECHGTAGQGGGAAGPRIAPMEFPYDAFIAQLRTPMNEMPPFEAKVVPDKDAADIYAYLKSIPAPQSPKDIPLLND
jgi:mono/diheme cytochrome c family protein